MKLILALALAPAASAMGIYVPDGCMETPNGNVIQKFELNAYPPYRFSTGPGSPSREPISDRRRTDIGPT